MFQTKNNIRKTILQNLEQDFKKLEISDTPNNRLDYLVTVVDFMYQNHFGGHHANEKVRQVIDEIIADIKKSQDLHGL